MVCQAGHRHSSRANATPRSSPTTMVGRWAKTGALRLQLNNPVWCLRATRQASEGCRHQVEFRLELRNPSELHAQLSFRGGETLFDSPDRCGRRPDDAATRRGWCRRHHQSLRSHCEHLRFSRAYARRFRERMREMRRIGVPNCTLAGTLERELWMSAWGQRPCEPLSTLQGNAEQSVAEDALEE